MTDKLKEFITKNASLIDDPHFNLEDFWLGLKYGKFFSELDAGEGAAFTIYYQIATGNPLIISLKQSSNPLVLSYLDYMVSYKPGERLIIYSVPLTDSEAKSLSSVSSSTLKNISADKIISYLSPELDNLDSNLIVNITKLIGEN